MYMYFHVTGLCNFGFSIDFSKYFGSVQFMNTMNKQNNCALAIYRTI